MRWLVAAVFLAACGGSDIDAVPGCGPNGECPKTFTCDKVTNRCIFATNVGFDAPPPDAPAPDAPLPDAPLPDAPFCPTFTGPTVHTTVTTDETWTAAGSPHVFATDLAVSATLTIEPCAEVQIGAKHEIDVNATGKIVAVGDPNRRIHFTAKTAGQPFASIHTVGGGTLHLAYVTIDGGGDPLNGAAASSGTLFLQGTDGNLPTQEVLFVDHVQIGGSATNGIVLRTGAGFAAGSTALDVGTSGQWPINMWARAAFGVPVGNYTGNAHDEIAFGAATGTAGIVEDMTLHDRGVPYRVGDGVGAPDLRVDAPNGSQKLVTLTIEPGVTLRFAKGGVMHVQTFTGTTPALAALVAVGTADKPIVFTSAEAAPAAGDWLGVFFGLVPDASNRIDHARFDYGGGDSSSGSSACGTTFGNITNDAEVRIYGPPASEFITNTVFAHSAGHGIDRGWRADNLTDFLPTNTFDGFAWCKESYPSTATGSCPPPASTPCPQ